MLIVEFVKGMLGPLAPLLDFILDNPAITSVVLLAWFAVYVAGRAQLWKIEQRTRDLVLQISQEAIARDPQLTAELLYKDVYPRWYEALPAWGWFVPHRLDLWPAPVTAKNVAPKIAFSPEWIADALREQDILLGESENRKQDPPDGSIRP